MQLQMQMLGERSALCSDINIYEGLLIQSLEEVKLKV